MQNESSKKLNSNFSIWFLFLLIKSTTKDFFIFLLLIFILSLKSKKCGEVKIPTLYLDSCIIDEMYADVLPFPFVPPTCIKFSESKDNSRAEINFVTLLRPGLNAFLPIAWYEGSLFKIQSSMFL